MATGQMSSVIQHFRRAALRHDGGGLTDGQLLERFLTAPSPVPYQAGERAVQEAAFEALVRRHGPMVLGVCRRVLKHTHDAEDAFQATFLVLVRKAASLLPRAAVGNWLYGVAYHTALKARAATMRRWAKLAQVRDMPKREALMEDTREDWQPLLDQELSRLPDKYREPIVLCDLEGKTRREVARQLGIPEGTLSGRLTTARRRLAKRLARHGVTLSAGSLAAILSQNGALACVPAPLVVTTVKAATVVAAGQAATAGVISAKVTALTEGVMKGMLITKLKVTAVFCVAVGVLAIGSGALVHHSLAGTAPSEGGDHGRPVAAVEPETLLIADEEPADEDAAATRREQPKGETTVGGSLQSVDTAKNTVTIKISNRRTGPMEKTFELAKDIAILRDGKAAKLSDLKPGGRVALKLSADQKTVVGISVVGSTVQAPLKSVDAAKNTITITTETRQGKVDKTFQVAKDAKVTVDGKDAKLADLKAGATVLLTLSAEDGNTVIQVRTPSRRGGEGEE